MRKTFAFALALGILLGIAVSTVGSSVVRPEAQAVPMAKVVGEGFLMGWTITYQGEDICHDPYVWDSLQEIECD